MLPITKGVAGGVGVSPRKLLGNSAIMKKIAFAALAALSLGIAVEAGVTPAAAGECTNYGSYSECRDDRGGLYRCDNYGSYSECRADRGGRRYNCENNGSSVECR